MSAGPLLDLAEVSGTNLRVADVVRGVVRGIDGRIVFWSDTAVFVSEGSGPVRVCADSPIRPRGAAVMRDSTIEIIDAAQHRVLRRSVSGECAQVAQGSLKSAVLAGVYTSNGWVLLEARDNVLSLVRLGSEQNVLVAQLPNWLGTSAIEPRLVATDSALVLTQGSWPFASAVYDMEGESKISFAPFLARGLETSRQETPFANWVSSGAFPLDTGFIQTVADLGTDRRILILMDHAGTTRRVAVLEAPMGIAATRPDRRELLAVRRGNGVAIVTYRWQWRSAGSHTQ